MEYCFAWHQDNRGNWSCKALMSNCNGMDDTCPFYKTPEQHFADRESALRRISTLSEEHQKAISEKYYAGEKPWLILAKTAEPEEVENEDTL